MYFFKTLNSKSLNDKELADKVERFLESKNMSLQDNTQLIFVAFRDDEIIGICGLRYVAQIEPLVADGYPEAARILAEKATAIASITFNSVMALVEGKDSNAKWINELEKYGFIITDTNMTVLKKEV
jgi:hypothetical protein